jgi:NitT/TauT family transport system substrate-binding protein
VRKLLRKILPVVVVACVAALSACGSSETPSNGSAAAGSGADWGPPGLDPHPLDAPATVNVVMSTKIEPFAPVLLGDSLGEFKKENITLKYQFLPGPDGLALLATGRSDVQVTGVNGGFFNAVSSGQHVRWAANVYSKDPSKQGFWARKDMLTGSGSLDPAKLRGARVAVIGGVGNPSILPLYQELDKHGLGMGDVELVNMTSAGDILVALEQGSIDVGYLLSPFWTEADRGDFAELVLGKGFQASIYAVNEDWVGGSPKVAQAFFRAVGRTIRDHLAGDYKATDEQRAALATAIEVEPNTLDATPLVFDPALPLDTSTITQLQDMWFKIGGILNYEDPIAPENLIDRSVVESVVGSK